MKACGPCLGRSESGHTCGYKGRHHARGPGQTRESGDVGSNPDSATYQLVILSHLVNLSELHSFHYKTRDFTIS